MNSIAKTVKRSEDLYIQFSDEELAKLGLKQGDKLSLEIENDGILLKKFVPLEINISDFSREVLEMLIIDSIEKDLTINEVIINILTEQLKNAL
jgi:hypothetical protein